MTRKKVDFYWSKNEKENVDATYYVVHTKKSCGMFSGPLNVHSKSEIEYVRKFIPNAVIREFKEYKNAIDALKKSFKDTEHKRLTGQVSIEIVGKAADFLDSYSFDRKWTVLFLNGEPFLFPQILAVTKIASHFENSEYVICDDYETAILIAKSDDYRKIIKYSADWLKKQYQIKKYNFWTESLFIDFNIQSFYGLPKVHSFSKNVQSHASVKSLF